MGGREKVYTGVRKIVAYGGEGDDQIYVRQGVVVPVEFHGGSGADTFVYEGSGHAVLYGDDGDDNLETGTDSRTAYFDGGDGDDFIRHAGTQAATMYGGAGADQIFGGPAADTIHGGDENEPDDPATTDVDESQKGDEIDGGGGADTIHAGQGNDLIRWSLSGAVLPTVDGGSGRDFLVVTATAQADTLVVSRPVHGSVRVAKGSGSGSITASSIEDLVVDLGAGGDTITVESLESSGVARMRIDAGQRIVDTGQTQVVSDGGQDVVVPVLLFHPDAAADTIRLRGTDAGDRFAVSARTAVANRMSEVGITHRTAGNTLIADIAIAHAVRSPEGDTLVIESQGGADDLDASALGDPVATDAVVYPDLIAVRLVAGEGDDRLVGTPFADFLDSGRGNDTVTGGAGLDEFRDASPSAYDGIDNDGDHLVDEADENEIDTLVEVQDADLALYNDLFIVGAILKDGSSEPFAEGAAFEDETSLIQRIKNEQNPNFNVLDAADRFAVGAVVESIANLFERATITGGKSNNTIVVNDSDGIVLVGGTPLRVNPWKGRVTLDNRGNVGAFVEHYVITIPLDNAGRIEIVDTGGGSGTDALVIRGTSEGDNLILNAAGSGSFRSGSVVASVVSRTLVTYRMVERVFVSTLGGSDRVLSNDTAVPTIVSLGSGDDEIVIGTVPLVPDPGNRTLEFPDGVPVADTENMTNGNSATLFVLGEGQNDRFEVNHNRGKLYLHGGAGNDRFLLKTFLVLRENPDNPDEVTNLSTLFGGTGSNRYDYLQNAPVFINGGPGVDTIIVVGTPIGDVFVVTDNYIAGAGRIATFTNVEAVEVDGAGGPDEIYVLATGNAFETTITGGSGDDTIHVDGSPPPLVFDPPPFSYTPPPVEVQLPPEVVYASYQLNLDGLGFEVSLLELLEAGGDATALVTSFVRRALDAWEEYFPILEIDAIYVSGATWQLRWDFFLPFLFDRSVDVHASSLRVDYRIGRLEPRSKIVQPSPVEVDPPAFAFKGDDSTDGTDNDGDGQIDEAGENVRNVARIAGRLKIVGGDQFPTLGDRVVVHNQDGSAAPGFLRVRTVPRMVQSGAIELPATTDGVDNDGNGQIDEPGEREDVAIYEQDRDPGRLTDARDNDRDGQVDEPGEDLLFDVSQSLEGLGLGIPLAGRQSVDGVTYYGIEMDGIEDVEVRLSSGDDHVTVEAAQEGMRFTFVGGAGSDTLDLWSVGGFTRVLGGAGDDVVHIHEAGSLAKILDRVLVDGDAHIAEQDVHYTVDDFDPADLANAPKVFVNQTFPLVYQGRSYALPLLDRIVEDDGTGNLVARVVLVDSGGSIVEGLVQEKGLAAYGVHRKNNLNQPLYFDIDGNQTTDATSTGVPVIDRAAAGAAGAQPVYVDVVGNRVFAAAGNARAYDTNFDTGVLLYLDAAGNRTADPGTVPNPNGPSLVPINRTREVAWTRVEDVRQWFAGTDTLVVDDSADAGHLVGSIAGFKIAAERLQAGRPVPHADPAAAPPTYHLTPAPRFYFGGEPVVDPFTRQPLTHAAGDPVLDLYDRTPVLDPFGRPLHYRAGDPMLHIAGDPVVHENGEFQRYLGGEPVLDESGAPVLNPDGSIFRHVADQARIHDRRQNVFDLIGEDGNRVEAGTAYAPPAFVATATAGRVLDLDDLDADGTFDHDLLAGDLVSVTVYDRTWIYNLGAGEFTVNAATNAITLFPASPIVRAVTIKVTIQTKAYNAAGDPKKYFGDEAVAVGQPVVDTIGFLVLDEAGAQVLYTAETAGKNKIEAFSFFNEGTTGVPAFATFDLAQTPAGFLEVEMGGEELTPGEYTLNGRSLRVTPLVIPVDGTQVGVTYRIGAKLHRRGEPVYELVADQWVEVTYPGGQSTANEKRYLGNEPWLYVGGEASFYTASDAIQDPADYHRLVLEGESGPGGAVHGMPGDILYRGLEALTVRTGSGDDTFTIDRTYVGAVPGPGTDSTTVFLETNAGADRVAVRAMDRAVTVRTGAGDDVVAVGSRAGLWDTDADPGPGDGFVGAPFAQFIAVNGTVNLVNAVLDLDSGADADRLDVDDTADPTDNVGSSTLTRIEGLGMAGGRIDYSAFEALYVHLGSGADDFTLLSTHAGAARTTNVDGRGGDDRIHVRTIDGPTTIAGDGLVDVLFYGVNPVPTGSGDDRIEVGTLAGVGGRNFEGVLEGIRAPLVVEGLGQADVDRLSVDDSGEAGDQAAVLTSSTLVGLGLTPAGIVYTGIDVLHVMLGLGADLFHVESTHVGVTRLSGGPGNDRFTVESISGGTEIEGDGPVVPAIETFDVVSKEFVRLLRMLDSTTAVAVRVNGQLLDYGTDYTVVKGDKLVQFVGPVTGLVHVTSTIDPAQFSRSGPVGPNFDDLVTVNVDESGAETRTNGIGGLLSIDGQLGTDAVVAYLAGLPHSATYPISVIDVHDSGLPTDGADKLDVIGPDDELLTDRFLLRRNFVALIPEVSASATPTAERVNYDFTMNRGLQVSGRAGDDEFSLDDNAVATTIDGGVGDDQFQVGQMFGSLREFPKIPFKDDVFDTVETTRGFLSNGISQDTTILGGRGEDRFVVFHNQALLNLDGGSGNDSFTVRAFALKGSLAIDPNQELTDIVGGMGSDFVEYTDNAPVSIDGGAGVDKVVIVGTEFSDTFVINRNGVYGAGLFVQFVAVETLEVDGLEGNDRFVVLETSPFLTTTIFGGTGSDTFDVGGDPVGGAVAVSSRDLTGHSGLILHSVETTDPAYTDAVVEGISAEVADNDEGAVVITPLGLFRMFEGAGAIDVADATQRGTRYAAYTVVLTRRPAGGNVFITVVPGEPLLEEQAAGQKALALRDPATGDLVPFRVLTFTPSDWYVPQTIWVVAEDDAVAEPSERQVSQSFAFPGGPTATFTLDRTPIAVESVTVNGQRLRTSEWTATGASVSLTPLLTPAVGAVIEIEYLLPDGATTFEAVRHSISGDSAANFRDVKVPLALFEVIDDDSAGVIVTQVDPATGLPDDRTQAGEGSATDAYTVALTRAPLAGETVTVTLVHDGQVTLLVGGVVTSQLAFTAANWSTPRLVQVVATDDAEIEGPHFSVLGHTVQSSLGASSAYAGVTARDLDAILSDDDAGTVLIRQTGGATSVVETGTSVADAATYVDPAVVAVGGAGWSDTYTVVLTRRPTTSVDVVIRPTFTTTGGQLREAARWSDLPGGQLALGKPPTQVASVRIDGRKLGTGEFQLAGQILTLTPTLSPAPSSQVEVVYRFAQGATQVGVSTVNALGQVMSSTTEIRLTFTPSDWDVARVVTVGAIDDATVDGDAIQVFAPQPRRLQQVRGPLRIEGGSDPAGDRTLPLPLLYVGEIDPPEFVPDANSNLLAIETEQIDVLNLLDTDAVGRSSGVLTDRRITGLGLGPDRIVGGQLVAGGVTYSDLEMLRLNLGRASDRFLVESTHGGSTTILGNKGDDQIFVRTVGGPTFVLGEAGNDTFDVGTEYDADLFDLPIDHAGAPPRGVLDRIRGLLTFDGGAGADTMNVDDSGDATDNVGVLSGSTLDDLDMRAARVRTVSLSHAAGGTFRIRVGAAGPWTGPLPYAIGSGNSRRPSSLWVSRR